MQKKKKKNVEKKLGLYRTIEKKNQEIIYQLIYLTAFH